jgi:DNA-binding NtrC family response regulator
LDEIGDLDLAIQVKLLRVVQSRTYTRLGETEEQRFLGKIMAATNRDLTQGIAEGNFREDLYYRLCSDRIETPSLRDHLADGNDALSGMIAFIAQRIGGDDAACLTDEVDAWIKANLPQNYPWPGNIRELEQCVRNILIRKEYRPNAASHAMQPTGDAPGWLFDAIAAKLSANELVGRYCAWVYSKVGSYNRTSEIVGLDRRTVKSKIDELLLASLEK